MRRQAFLVALILLFLIAGCATPAVPTSVGTIMENPSEFKNRNISVTAQVLSNSAPSGDLYRTWNFVIGSPETGQILVTEAGYNPATIERAYELVSQAQEAGEPVTITGQLRVGPYGALRAGTEIQLKTVTYRNTTIDTGEGPYVGGFYSPYYWGPPYYEPYFYPGPFFWGYGRYPYGYGWWGKNMAPEGQADLKAA